jgi:hypothetical protein
MKNNIITDDTSVGSGAVSLPSFPLGMKSPTHKNNDDEIFRRKDWALFTVKSETFSKFETGRNRYERWSKYLSDEIEEEKAVKEYAKKNPTHTVVLQNADNGALRSIRRRAI